MNRCLIIRRLLAVLLIVGLTAPALVMPAAAQGLPAVVMTGMADMAGVSGMSDDMQCCPDTHKDRHCPDCPLVAMCMSVMALANPDSISIPVFFSTRRLFFIRDDVIAEGLVGPPPDHPPRTSI